jgi:hypothetical protein
VHYWAAKCRLMARRDGVSIGRSRPEFGHCGHRALGVLVRLSTVFVCFAPAAALHFDPEMRSRRFETTSQVGARPSLRALAPPPNGGRSGGSKCVKGFSAASTSAKISTSRPLVSTVVAARASRHFCESASRRSPPIVLCPQRRKAPAAVKAARRVLKRLCVAPPGFSAVSSLWAPGSAAICAVRAPPRRFWPRLRRAPQIVAGRVHQVCAYLKDLGH